MQRFLFFVVAFCACIPLAGCARLTEPQLPDGVAELVCAQLEGQDAEDCRTLAEWLELTAELVERVDAIVNEQQARSSVESESPAPGSDERSTSPPVEE